MSEIHAPYRPNVAGPARKATPIPAQKQNCETNPSPKADTFAPIHFCETNPSPQTDTFSPTHFAKRTQAHTRTSPPQPVFAKRTQSQKRTLPGSPRAYPTRPHFLIDMTSAAPAPYQPLPQDEELHWLALQLVPGLGPKRAVQLVERYRNPQAVFRASRSELEAAGIPSGAAQTVSSGCTFEDAVSQHQKMREHAAVLIPYLHPLYPATLKEIPDPPLALFARGRAELLQTLIFAIVGTRRPTPYGTAVAERLGADLAQMGLTIASGMARGIDTAAHKGALSVNGDTIAVLGCGVDVLYPVENRKLAEDLTRRGLLLSEFPMGTPGYPQNFPIRNRIISGMGTGVLVVEGAQYSGSAITARMAMEQGRDVFAVPGNITNKMSWGPNLLIKQGAKLVQNADDVISELPPHQRRFLAQWLQEQASQLPLPLDKAATLGNGLSKQLLGSLRPDQPVHVDELLENLPQYSSSELIAALFELEMLGLVRQLPGKKFVKVW